MKIGGEGEKTDCGGVQLSAFYCVARAVSVQYFHEKCVMAVVLLICTL